MRTRSAPGPTRSPPPLSRSAATGPARFKASAWTATSGPPPCRRGRVGVGACGRKSPQVVRFRHPVALATACPIRNQPPRSLTGVRRSPWAANFHGGLAPFPLLGLAGGITEIPRRLLFGFQREIAGGFLGGFGFADSLLGLERGFVGCLSGGFLGRLLCRRAGFAGQPGGFALRDAGIASNLDSLPGGLALGALRVVRQSAVPLQRGLLGGRGGALTVGEAFLFGSVHRPR